MNRRSLLGLFLTAPLGVCAAQRATLDAAEALRRQETALDATHRMACISDELHLHKPLPTGWWRNIKASDLMEVSRVEFRKCS